MNLKKLRIPLLAALTFGLLPAFVSAQAFVELPNNRRIPVERILSRLDGTLTVFTADGQSSTLTRDQYVRAVGVRPPQLDQANQLIAQGRAADAIAPLNEAIRAAAFQSWDVVAGVTLANLHLENDRAVAAQEVVDSLRRRYGDRTNDLFPQLLQVEWRARIASGRVAGLEEELTQAIRSGRDRNRAAVALLTRGDMKHSRANLREAVLDYLRAAYFFRANEQVHAEALFKAARTFQELGETATARRYFNELREQHPQSEFTARIPAN